MQLVTYGTQDLTLTGNPEITFFNIIYRRYTNFGKKIISLSFDNSPQFNSISYATIPKNSGDLLTKSILKIKLPKIDFTFINNAINERLIQNKPADYNLEFSYYDYFLNFYNKLKNIIKTFFFKYDINNTSITYINDLKNYILKYINYYQYYQFFLSINYFFNTDGSGKNLINYNIQLYTNASLFKIFNNTLTYIYETFSYETLSYIGFKYTINKNIEILEEVNTIIYNKIYTNLKIYSNDKIKFCWVNKIGIYLFNSIEFYIGSNKIYELSDTYINNYGELNYKNKELYNNLIGNQTNINIFSNVINEEILYLPIPFWNISNYGLSFPLISLQFNSLQIKINLKKFLDCIKISYDKTYFNENINNLIIDILLNNIKNIVLNNVEITLILEYIYLDSIERTKFAKSAHEYLIEQVQEIEFNKISQNNNTMQLDIFHCCKDMYWFIQKIPTLSDIFNNNPNVLDYIYQNNNISLSNDLVVFKNYLKMIISPFVLFDLDIFYNGIYTYNKNLRYINEFFKISSNLMNVLIHPIKNEKINIIILESYFSLNGIQLIGENYLFFNYLQPYNYYNSSPQLGLNVYSFSLKPTEFQPSGSCNMSRISYIGLKLKIRENLLINSLDKLILNNDNTNILDEYKLIFQTRNYNVLRLIGGIGATAYTY